MKNHLKKIKEDFKYKPKKEKSFKDFLNEMRKLKEEVESENRKTVYDEKSEQRKLLNSLPSDVVINFEDLEIYDDRIIWGGTINNDFNFFYKVTEDGKGDEYDFNFISGFDPTGEELGDSEEADEYVEEKMEIFEKIQHYYDEFSNYWRNELWDK